MGIIRTVIFITSILAVPAGAFLLVLYIVIDIVRYQQKKEESVM